MRSKRTLLSWSSGKDCAWALHKLRQDPHVDVVGLFCTVNQAFDRVVMHGVRVVLLQQQAANTGLPLHIIRIPSPCSNSEYASAMSAFVDSVRRENIECFAFGDLFLEDVRKYREDHLKGTGITPIFPLWGIPTDTLSREMIAGGLKAVTTCIDPKRISDRFAGRIYNASFLEDLPDNVDPCGEYGEFHTFSFDGPMFEKPVGFIPGETVLRDNFVFTDLLPLAPDIVPPGQIR
ncbi:ATP-binding protein [Nitrosomonas sp. HPC101]|nr:ATP-binding protein [Nitrosomonas sp. HPC101]